MRRAACCCTTNSNGPSLPCATCAGGSGVASKLRLAEYSLSALSSVLLFATRRILNGNDQEAATGMTTAKIHAGASGYSFKEWCGSFYPEKMKPDAMLAWYAERLPSVEINNTFYQMPK